MRLKYPHIAVGALASSAPLLQFEDVVPSDTFYDIVSNDFKVCIAGVKSLFMCSTCKSSALELLFIDLLAA